MKIGAAAKSVISDCKQFSLKENTNTITMSLGCQCYICNKVLMNLERNNWFFSGKIRLNPEDLVVGNTFSAEDVFNRPVLYGGYRAGPTQAFQDAPPIMCDAGSFPIRPYCHYDHPDECIDWVNKLVNQGKMLLQITDPVNVLKISSIEELDAFAKKYGDRGVYSRHINWKAVQDDGYYGASFSFRKVEHLPGSRPKEKRAEDLDVFGIVPPTYHAWRTGFDREACWIWDLRAIPEVTVVGMPF